MVGIVPIPTDSLGQPLPFRENRFRRVFLLVFVLGITIVFLGIIRSFLITILLGGDLRGSRISAVQTAGRGVPWPSAAGRAGDDPGRGRSRSQRHWGWSRTW